MIPPARRLARAVLLAAAWLAAGCGDGGGDPGPWTPTAPLPGTSVRMDFTRAGGLWSAPVPSDDLVLGDGAVALDGLPNPDGIALVDTLAALASRAGGFGASSTVYLPLDGPPDEAAVPDVHTSVLPGAAAFLLDVDPASQDLGRRYPLDARWLPDGGPFGAPGLLALLPLQGVPLRPRTLHAAVVLRSLGDAAGAPLGRPPALAALLSGHAPGGLEGAALAAYRHAVTALAAAGIDLADLAGLAVFTTADPAEGLQRWVAAARALPTPAPTVPFARDEVFDTYCVYGATVDMPVFQAGEPPFAEEGGGWVLGADGRPALQGYETARLVITVPRAPVPPGGVPAVVLIRTGAGGDRPLVDRGPRAEPGGPALAPGTGPALTFAAAGFAGVSVDGPHGGLRNVTGGDEQFLVFNVLNPLALRDNVRQSALEIALVPALLDGITLDASDCPGVGGPVTFDPARVALMGHSMGATIAPLAVAAEPRFGAVILSGAGGSYVENLVYKELPLATRPVAELLLGYAARGRALDRFDPALWLLQWAGEPADPPLYGAALAAGAAGSAAPHVLMLQGIVDHYILPPMANAASLSLGLDLAGPSLDAAAPELAVHRPLAEVLPLAGGRALSLPAAGNRARPDGTEVTAVVVQHPGDGVEDGHEAVFQTAPPKAQIEAFVTSWREGRAPTVPEP